MSGEDLMFLDYETELRSSFELLQRQMAWIKRENRLPDTKDRQAADQAFKNTQMTLSAMRMRTKGDSLMREIWEPKIEHFTDARKKLKKEYAELIAKIEKLQLFLTSDSNSGYMTHYNNDYHSLNGGESDYNSSRQGVSSELQERMAQTNRELLEGHDMLETSVQQLRESEQTGHQVLNDLSTQREVIVRITNNVGVVGEELSNAVSRIASMIRRNKKNKVLSVVIVSLIILCLLLLAFFNSTAMGMVCFACLAFAIFGFAYCAGVFSDLQLGLLMPTSFRGSFGAAGQVMQDMELGPVSQEPLTGTGTMGRVRNGFSTSLNGFSTSLSRITGTVTDGVQGMTGGVQGMAARTATRGFMSRMGFPAE